MTYRHSFLGHQGGLKNPASSKAERLIAERAAKAMTKEELARHLAQVEERITNQPPMDYEYFIRLPKARLMSLAVIYHVHAFNLRTDNYD